MAAPRGGVVGGTVLKGGLRSRGGCFGGWESGRPFRVFRSRGARSEEDDEHGAGRALASLDEVALRLTRGQVDHIVRWSKGINGRAGCFFLVLQGRGVRRGPAQAYISGSRQFPDGSVIAYGMVGTPLSGSLYKYTWEVQCGTVKLSNGKSKCSVSVEGSEEPNMEELCFKTGTCKAKAIMRTSSTDADRGRIGNDSGSGNE
jgi:hypothetical protein